MKFSSQELKEMASYFRKELASQILDADLNNPFLLDVIDIDLSTAGSRDISYPFKTIWFKQGTDNTINLDFYPNRQDSSLKPVPMTLNDVLKFDRMLAQGKLQWAAQAGKTAKLVVATEIDFTSGALINSITGSVVSKNSFNSEIAVSNTAATPSVGFTVPANTVFRGTMSLRGTSITGAVGVTATLTRGGTEFASLLAPSIGAGSTPCAGVASIELPAGTYTFADAFAGASLTASIIGACYNV